MSDAPVPAVANASELSDTGIIALAFGRRDAHLSGLNRLRHLALLPNDALELDLADPEQRRFGDYELLELLGEGGMGIVYRARHLSLDREVAVKLLAAGPWASHEFIERFQHEAQNAARMQHPNIVAIHEVGEAEGLHFFSMRLVRGGSLAESIKREGRLDPRRAARLLRTIAEAVDYAHRLGVLHLDLKPANVLLDEQGVPHVADFGLARRLEQGASADNEEISGTPAYMAPEQAEPHARKISPATDLWGLGAILHEVACGQPPFQAGNAHDTLRLVRDAQVRPPRSLVPGLPRDLEAIILKCLQRDPAARYACARELADDLGRFVERRAVRARPLNAAQHVARWTGREPALAGATLLALAALLLGLVVSTAQWRKARGNEALARESAALARHTAWSSRDDAAQRQIAQGDAYAAIGAATENLREMEASGERDGAALERLRIGTVLANAPQLIATIPVGDGKPITALTIAPDGTSAAVVTAGRTLHLIDVASGKERWRVDAAPSSSGMTAFGLNQSALEVHFSDDGQRLIGHCDAYGPASGVNPALVPHAIDSVLIDVATGKPVQPPAAFADFLAVSFSENGRHALLFDRHGGVQRWRTLPWSAEGDLARIDGDIAATPDGGVQMAGEALLSDDGATMVLVNASKLGLRSFDAQHMHLQQTLELDTEQDRATAWAMRHDDRQLAIGTTAGQLAVWELASGKVTWLHGRLDGWISRLGWSTDDSRLLAISSEPGEMRVFDAHALEPIALPVALADNTNSGSMDEAGFGADAATVLTRFAKANAVVWRLPEPGLPLQMPVAAAPPMIAAYTRFALARDARSQLMATAGNGMLNLWHVRWTPFIGGTAAPMVSDALRFDGSHLVSASGNRVQAFDVANGQPVGSAIALPQAPTFAGLDGSGERLIAIAGRELSCWHWRDGKPCWPAITLPQSPLRLGLAASAPLLAISTGSNERGEFFEHVRLIDLANGRQRGAPIVVRGPLGALRLSDDSRRLLVFEYRDIFAADSNVLRLVDTSSAGVVESLVHTHTPGTRLIDARFADDGTIWSLSGATGWGEGPDSKLWHWDANGKPLGKPVDLDDAFDLQPLPHGRGAIATNSLALTLFDGALTTQKTLSVAPDASSRVDADAISPDGHLLALGMLDGVALLVVDRNQRLVPDLKLALPNHEAVQQLAFAADGSRLVGRTTSGRWFGWRITADARPVATIERDLHLRDLTTPDTGTATATEAASALTEAERATLRDADTGPTRQPSAAAANAAGSVATQVVDTRYAPLNIDAIANVEPRAWMNRTSRVPPMPQSLPTLPSGLQRYAGVDFLLGRAVQLSGAPLNPLNTKFPAQSQWLRIAPQRVAAIDALVFQFDLIAGEAGAVRLRYADGGERTLTIADDRDTRGLLDTRPTGSSGRRIGWLGTYSTALHFWGMGDSGEMTIAPSFVVRLANPEPSRPVTALSLSAPPTASPGLLFLALTLEPAHAPPAP